MKPNTLHRTHLILHSCLILAALLLLPCAAQAQTPSLSVGTAAGLPGTNVDISVSFTPGATAVSSLQFELTFPSSLGYVSTATGAAATAAGKSATGNAIAGGVRVLVFGLNQNAIGSGAVAIITLSIAGGTPAGNIAIGIMFINASDPNGSPVTVTGTGGTVTVNAPADTTPPTISNVSAGSITQTSAAITWTTNEAADSQVEYGTTTSYGSSTTLDSTRVTAHSQALSGLTAGTLYHYRVRSSDAAGNLAVSTDYTFTTASGSDTTPPVISAVSASGITPSSAAIRWITNEPADTQVEYGTTAAYGWSTSLNGAATTTHNQTLSGLSASTTYHYRVRSRDTAGNLAVSTDYTFRTADPDSESPGITDVRAEPGDLSAIITWTTDEPSTSQVEFGTTNAYGEQSAVSNRMVTSHWVRLTGLTELTEYHFRVLSNDPSGNLAVSMDHTFRTTKNEQRQPVSLHLPTLSGGQGSQSALGSGDNEYTGIALANLDTVDANVIFTAFDADGNPLAGANITNPKQLSLKPGAQLPKLDYEIFGAGSDRIGWMRIESGADKVTGFFLTFDTDLIVLDGATASAEPVSSFILPEIGEGGFTRIYLANPNSEPASVTLKLMKSDGSPRASASRVINAYGVLNADIYTDIFQSTPDPTDYIQGTSDRRVVPFEMLGETGKHIRVLSGQDTGKGFMRIYSPQYAVGGPWRSTVSVINLDPWAASVTMKFIPKGSTQPTSTVVRNIPANGKIYLSDQSIFVSPGSVPPGAVAEGYLDICSSGGARLSGSVAFGDSQGESFSSALPLVGELRTSVVFSHVASNDTYFTGLALLNPGLSAAMARIELYDAEGNRQESADQIVPAQTRISRLLTEYFPNLIYQSWTSGYIRVSSTVPTGCFALFGTNNLSVLSAIPAQPAP
ncbi:MAG: fibronectin type III domain-containing protein [Acidobacteria bacterium]|nr:fibronectin type III domain-containing protein [Acidobacteriota bacterium]